MPCPQKVSAMVIGPHPASRLPGSRAGPLPSAGQVTNGLRTAFAAEVAFYRSNGW
ncbi:MAG: hypothetical protein ACRDOK_25090 [Streptosporangiaceae bacterium]